MVAYNFLNCMKLSMHDFFQHQNLNALLIQNALTTLHVYKRNVKILVMLTLVAKMQNVKQRIIVQFVFVFRDTSVIPINFAKNVRIVISEFCLYSVKNGIIVLK